MSFGKHIQQIRKNNYLSQEEFANCLFVTRQTVSNWENEKCYPDLDTLITISNMFEISLDTMLKDSSNISMH